MTTQHGFNYTVENLVPIPPSVVGVGAMRNRVVYGRLEVRLLPIPGCRLVLDCRAGCVRNGRDVD